MIDPWILDAQDHDTAFIKFADGYDKVVIRRVEPVPDHVAATDKEMQKLFNIVASSHSMLNVLKRVAAGEQLTGPDDLLGDINAIIEENP